jgi:AcrR family transcriptional regulator
VKKQMNKIRKPIQKRSIEKMDVISKAGFDLFCEKGYHKTNTIEISKRAGVSTGAVYSYFRNKRDIYIAAFDQYLNFLSKLLFEKLERVEQPFDLSVFVGQWISSYIDLYAASSYALMQLRVMMLEDEEINRHFCDFENEYFTKIVEMLSQNGVSTENLLEKVCTACILVDAINREKFAFPHRNLNFNVLKEQMSKAIINLLLT